MTGVECALEDIRSGRVVFDRLAVLAVVVMEYGSARRVSTGWERYVKKCLEVTPSVAGAVVMRLICAAPVLKARY